MSLLVAVIGVLFTRIGDKFCGIRVSGTGIPIVASIASANILGLFLIL
jgi:hypothetical protein